MLAFFWLTNKKVSPESAFVFRGFNKGQTYVIYFQRMERNRQPSKPSVLPFTLAALDLSVSDKTTLQNGTFPMERKRKHILTSLQKERLKKLLEYSAFLTGLGSVFSFFPGGGTLISGVGKFIE